MEGSREPGIAAKTAQENAEAIVKWRAGEYARLPYNIDAMLRISADGQNVETSNGVNFPIAHAKRGLALVRSVMARGEAWETNGHTCHLGHYRIERIAPNGDVTAGCHFVKFSEIECVAPQIEACSKELDEQAAKDIAAMRAAANPDNQNEPWRS